jgi:predicted ester cyclase
MDEGDLDAWEQTMEPECEFVAPGASFRGREAVRAFVEAFRDAFPDVRHTIESLHTAGDRIVFEGSFVGTHTGPLRTPGGGEIPPTGKPILVRQVQIVELREGRAASIHTYFDRLELMGQLGLLPTSGSP